MEINLGDIVQMRKKHPCGSYEWKITRLGVDIGMVCTICERKVLIPRSKFNRRAKKIVTKATQPFDQTQGKPPAPK